MDSQEPLDYYAALDVAPTATQKQIRKAYKIAALKTHPDRLPPDSPKRAEQTRKFQIVNDAYYTLSSNSRRTDYDTARKYYNFDADASSASEDDVPKMSDGFPWSSFGFGLKTNAEEEKEKEKFRSEQFRDVFEEILRDKSLAGDENNSTGHFWSLVGSFSGAAMGFIIANFPGLIAGVLAGNRLGAIRDKKGKSVYEVYQELPASDKANLLKAMASSLLRRYNLGMD